MADAPTPQPIPAPNEEDLRFDIEACYDYTDKNHPAGERIGLLIRRCFAAERERDAALAKVRELEARMERMTRYGVSAAATTEAPDDPQGPHTMKRETIRLRGEVIVDTSGVDWTEDVTLIIHGTTLGGKNIELHLTMDTAGVVCAVSKLTPLLHRKVEYAQERLDDLRRAVQ